MGWDLGSKHFHGKEWHPYHLHLQNSSDNLTWLSLHAQLRQSQPPGFRRALLLWHHPALLHTLSLAVCHSSLGTCSWAASQAAAVPQKHWCQHKYHTVPGNFQPDPRAFCTLIIHPGSKSSMGKLEMIVSKGKNLSYFTPHLTSGLTCFYKSTSQGFHSHIPVRKCDGPFSKVMIPGKIAPSQKLHLSW